MENVVSDGGNRDERDDWHLLVNLPINACHSYRARMRTSTTADFYAADSRLTAAQNGFALEGDCAAPRPSSIYRADALTAWTARFYALGPLSRSARDV